VELVEGIEYMRARLCLVVLFVNGMNGMKE
jgi:hypothetical protein